MQAHDLEQERKESEELGGQLRRHIESFGRQFDRIRDKVPLPAQPPVTTTTTEQQQQQQQGKECHDETLEKELSDIRAQIEDAKNKYFLSRAVL